MIPYLELRSAARTAGVPASTIERDYVQNWFLCVLAWNNLALKGGTAIRKAYIPDYRFSDDLDFTLISSVKMEKLQDTVNAAVENVKKVGKIQLEEAKHIAEVENGFMMVLRFKLQESPYDTIKIKLDFTNAENEDILTPLRSRPLIHRYSDECVTSLTCYSLEEMAAEKIRSLYQRTRARDLYDVWYLLSYGHMKESAIREIFRKKCANRGVTVDFAEFEGRKAGFRAAWKSSLAHQMKEVPEFEKVFNWVVTAISRFDGDIQPKNMSVK
jgi:predicted nucleotidyltransferase component of viral defense system